MSLSQLKKPELLAPAGDWDCVRAAVANGADAVYFGLEAGFNARARATNFSLDDLPALLEFVHAHGVKAYVTLNTLVFPSELPRLEEYLRRLATSGIDAVLIQDIGLSHLAREIAPQLPVHASTQMTLTSSQSIQVAERFGIQRVVAPRELSLDEIQRVCRETSVPLEVFVHGALCVAYSGQCLTSESLGGRSANRGECAQACRLAYELICDGKTIDLGAQSFLLSPQDLAAYDLIPELVAAGVQSFKIEGRLKTAEYVANITRHYRRAIDAACVGQRAAFDDRDVEEMELSFSRGFSPGWLEGCDHKRLVPGLSSAKRGVLLGEVASVRRDRVRIALQRRVKRGDGVVFEGDRQRSGEQGGRVYEIFLSGKPVTNANPGQIVDLAFAHGTMDFARIVAGTKLWKTDDPELNRKLRKTFQTGQTAATQTIVGLILEVTARAGEPLLIRGQTSTGFPLQYVGTDPLPIARKEPTTRDEIAGHLDRFGNTRFEIQSLDAVIDGVAMVPRSQYGLARRAIVDQLSNLPADPPSIGYPTSPPGALERLRGAIRSRMDSRAAASSTEVVPRLNLLCRTLEQLERAIALPVETIYADFADIRDYRDAVSMARLARRPLFLATPRIQKPEEYGIFHAMARHGADGFLVRNLGGMAFCVEQQLSWIGDYTLNATNELTCDYFFRHGATRLTPSYDLNRDQLMELVDSTLANHLEVVVHQHMPMFHMEHCVFCAVLSPGTNKHNCGRPCDVHQVRLRDRMGIEHTLTADVGCRNTLFNGVAQSAAEAVPALRNRGVQHFRIELLESDTHIDRTVDLYRRLLEGSVTGTEVWRELQASNRVGVTRGTLEERRNPLAIL